MKKGLLILLTIAASLLILFPLRKLPDYATSADGTEPFVLSAGADTTALTRILCEYGYTDDRADGLFAARLITANMRKGLSLDKLADLQKRAWQATAAEIDSCGGPMLRMRLQHIRANLGILDEGIPDFTGNDSCQGVISVRVFNEIENPTFAQKLFSDGKAPAEGVAVRISRCITDSTVRTQLDTTTQVVFQPIGKLITDANGQVVFSGLDPSFSYSVLPVDNNTEFGAEKGTIGGTLAQVAAEDGFRISADFTGKPLKIRLFSNPTLRQMRTDGKIVVRSADNYSSTVKTYAFLFALAWILLYCITWYKKRTTSAALILPLVYLSALCVAVMFSFGNPLNDSLFGADMGTGVIAGIAVMAFLQAVDFNRFFHNRYRLMPFDFVTSFIQWLLFTSWGKKMRPLTRILSGNSSSSIRKSGALALIILGLPLLIFSPLSGLGKYTARFFDRLPKGSGYLLLAVLLTAALFPFGSAVGGMKVNLVLGGLKFQPSEIAKYLIVIFMAAYFATNAEAIYKYSRKGNTTLTGSKFARMGVLLLGLALLMLMYLALGDMGPALVIAFTFIFMYSTAKSKVDNEKSLSDVFTCDFAMLIYGVLLFGAVLWLGFRFGAPGLACLLWFAAWIILGLLRRQIFESAILFNFIIACFIFGSSVLGTVVGESDVVKRLDSRMEMCTNTWGTLGLYGEEAAPGENSQVAEGLWGIASGGLSGQGLNSGSPENIPAFQTDMILTSISEYLGFAGILLVVVLLALLLRRAVITGYRSGNTFGFYLCTGIATVTAVQFIIITLGCTGVIPLTGITVPFLSYGKVSLILNLAAFGIVYSYSCRQNADTVTETAATPAGRDLRRHNLPVALLSIFYCLASLLILGTFFKYAFISRDETLIRPIYVNSANGVPIISYNPRINSLTDQIRLANIYDRNGHILATSDRSALAADSALYSSLGLDTLYPGSKRRFYPFGNHLFFMVENFGGPTGYYADTRHLSELRGYDNRLINEQTGEPLRITLRSDSYRPSRFSDAAHVYELRDYQLRDYSMLLPLLKSGADNVDELYEEGVINPRDVYLTVDAVLQTRLQNRIAEYMADNYTDKKFNKTRVSVVVLDASRGDLLASANYPLPDRETVQQADGRYNDNNKASSWKAFTHMDLGIGYPTAPGSTGKIMSSLAGLKGLGLRAADPDYIFPYKQEQSPGMEPSGRLLNMRDAVAYSSCSYFIGLINENNLYPQLDEIYRTVGAQIEYTEPATGKSKARSHAVRYYGLDYFDHIDSLSWEKHFAKGSAGAPARFAKYLDDYENHRLYKESDPKKTKLRKVKMIYHPAWMWTWGQGMSATPLTIARVASTVGNNGTMPVTRYTLRDTIASVPVVKPEEAKALAGFMKLEAYDHSHLQNKISGSAIDINRVGGKTGTADRNLKGNYYRTSKGVDVYDKANDAWYMFFIENANVAAAGEPKRTAPLAVAVRMERMHNRMSGEASKLSAKVVFDVLHELGYIE